ncbi:MAG TPA: hypothetical protein DEA55_11620 [Rhodospirillaceae bacterium]|nr:hypothetical protein [Rhodospirillaceae bacterium]
MGGGYVADKITDGKASDVAGKAIKETAKEGFKYAAEAAKKANPFDFDFNFDFDMGKMLEESWKFLKENFEENTAAYLGAGAGLLSAYYANGSSWWRATVGIALGAAVYFGYKHFFQNDFNKSANPPGLAMQLEANPETQVAANRTSSAPATTTTAGTTGQPLTKEAKQGLSRIFEQNEQTMVASNKKKEMPEGTQPEAITDEPTPEVS